MRKSGWSRRLVITIAVGIFLARPTVTYPQTANDPVGEIEFADPEMQADGTMSPAAAAAMTGGALRLESDIELKAATDSAAQSEARERPWSASELGPIGELPGLARPNAPIVVGGLSFAG